MRRTTWVFTAPFKSVVTRRLLEKNWEGNSVGGDVLSWGNFVTVQREDDGSEGIVHQPIRQAPSSPLFYSGGSPVRAPYSEKNAHF